MTGNWIPTRWLMPKTMYSFEKSTQLICEAGLTYFYPDI
jgi:hypothetical protein